VLSDSPGTTRNSGGKLTFRTGSIAPSASFGAHGRGGVGSRVTLALAALWKSQNRRGQDIHVDVRSSAAFFSGFFAGKWDGKDSKADSPLLARDNQSSSADLSAKTRWALTWLFLQTLPPDCSARAQFPMRSITAASRWPNAIDANGVRKKNWEAGRGGDGLVFGMVRSKRRFRNERH